MTPYKAVKIGAWAAVMCGALSLGAASEDKWLEESRGERALAWVKEHNEATGRKLSADPRYRQIYEAALALSEEGEGISRNNSWFIGPWIYNHAVDRQHPRGVLRRISADAFKGSAGKWETVLDLDALGKSEHHAWSYPLPFCNLREVSRCMIMLGDAQSNLPVYREFDMEKKVFAVNGFKLPGSLGSSIAWFDENTLLIAADSGADTVNGFGMPRVVKQWRRGQERSTAKEIFRASAPDMSVDLMTLADDRKPVVLVRTSDAGLQSAYWILKPGMPARRMLLPNYGEGLVLYRGQAVFVLGADWRSGDSVWPRGSLVSIAMRQASSARPLTLMMTPGPREMIAIQDSSATSAGLLVTTYSQVRARLQRFTWVQGQWQREAIPLPDNGTVRLGMSQSDAATAFVTYESFLRPQTLYRVDAKHGKATPMASTSSECGNGTLLTEQLHAESPDGTSIPYFVTRPGDLKRDAEAPTLMLGYGASGAAETATYNAALCQFWLIRGGVYVVANIRGGGELGPAWNLRGAERRHTYEDFIAVAEDLIKRKITMPRRLGILGASSGGLLMGVMYNQRPDLFNAIVIQSPVLDLFRNDLLMGGAAVTIFGSAEEPRERAFMEATSPYQNLRARAEAPIPFIMTNTSDDNVHPAMARRFAAKMQALNLPFFYYEAPEGGHGLWSTPEQRAQYEALFYTYLMQRLMD